MLRTKLQTRRLKDHEHNELELCWPSANPPPPAVVFPASVNRRITGRKGVRWSSFSILTLAACAWTHKLCRVRSCTVFAVRRHLYLGLQDVIQPVAVTSRRRLRSASSSALVVPRQRDELRSDSETELLPTRDLVHGTVPVFLNSSPTAHLLAPSENISRPTYFHYHFRAR